VIIPATRYRDVEVALGFLTGLLGLTLHAVHRDSAGAIVHAQLVTDAGMLMVAPMGEGGAFDAFVTHPDATEGRETVTVYVVVADVASRYARAVAGAADILIPLQSAPYGGLSFSLRDPEGHVWTLGSYDPRKG
jgi:uncharacterized glyoxalase superfamily protein PhnB